MGHSSNRLRLDERAAREGNRVISNQLYGDFLGESYTVRALEQPLCRSQEPSNAGSTISVRRR
eukprot:scaffold23_cov268-Pinguiococcus_pyrenoidosus.AAC.4